MDVDATTRVATIDADAGASVDARAAALVEMARAKADYETRGDSAKAESQTRRDRHETRAALREVEQITMLYGALGSDLSVLDGLLERF